MLKEIALILLFFPTMVYADHTNNLSDHVVASTIKTLAKGFVQTMDVEKMKAKQTQAILKMDDVKFHKRFIEISDVLKDLPPDLQAQYGFKENMTKEDVVMKIQNLDKKILITMIDEVPDQLIIKQLKNYLRQTADQVKDFDQNFLNQINVLWKKIIQKS